MQLPFRISCSHHPHAFLTNEWGERSHAAFVDTFWFAWRFFCVKSNKTTDDCNKVNNSPTDSDERKQATHLKTTWQNYWSKTWAGLSVYLAVSLAHRVWVHAVFVCESCGGKQSSDGFKAFFIYNSVKIQPFNFSTLLLLLSIILLFLLDSRLSVYVLTVIVGSTLHRSIRRGQ